MLTKTAFGLALVLATVSGSLAAAKNQQVAPNPTQNVNNPSGAYVDRGSPLVQDCIHVHFPQCGDGGF